MPPALPRREALAGIGGALGLGAGLGVLRPGALMAAPAGRAPDPDDLAAGRADFDARFAAFRAGPVCRVSPAIRRWRPPPRATP